MFSGSFIAINIHEATCPENSESLWNNGVWTDILQILSVKGTADVGVFVAEDRESFWGAESLQQNHLSEAYS